MPTPPAMSAIGRLSPAGTRNVGRRPHEQKRAGSEGRVQGSGNEPLTLHTDFETVAAPRRGADRITAHVRLAIDLYANGEELSRGEREVRWSGESKGPDRRCLVTHGKHRHRDELTRAPRDPGRGRQLRVPLSTGATGVSAASHSHTANQVACAAKPIARPVSDGRRGRLRGRRPGPREVRGWPTPRPVLPQQHEGGMQGRGERQDR